MLRLYLLCLGVKVLAVATLCSVTISAPAKAEFVVPNSTRNITASDWTRFIRLAHANNGDGVVLLPARRITASRCEIRTVGTTIRGRGAGRTILVGSSGDMFLVRSNNTTIQSLQVTGDVQPRLVNLFRGTFLRDRPQLERGLNRAVNIRQTGQSNFRMTDCFLRDVNVGIEFQQDSLPHGMVVRRTDFSVGSAMICCTAFRDSPRGQGNRLNRRIILDSLRHVNRDRVIRDSNRNMGIAGIALDFGNNALNFNLPAVDMRGSVISNCRFIRTSKWNIALNRAHNIVIRDNVFQGGGWANDTFTHALHFEDAGNTSTPIVIRNNTIQQRRRSSNNVFITGAVIPSHIWIGVTRSQFAPALRIEDNTFQGSVGTRLVLIKQNAGWDEIRDVPAQVAHTVGNDVPRNQLRRRPGPETRRIPGRGQF